MGRIVWNHSEKTAIFEEMVELFIAEPNMHPRDVLTRCQTVLPINRRRDVTYNTIFNYKTLVNKAEAEAKKRKLSRPKVSEAAPVRDELSETLEQLMKKFAVLVVDEIQRRYPVPFHIPIVRSKSVEEPVDPKPKSKEPTKAVPGILIIGLNGHQMSITKSRFPRKDLMFLHVDDASSYAAIKRDHTILMTKFISHSVQDKYRHAPNLHYCNGGLSELNTIISNIR